MAYNPIHDYRAKDALPSGSDQKVIRGADLSDEFEAIQGEFISISESRHASELASCKTGDGNTVNYGFNVASVAPQGSGIWRVTFKEPINVDGNLSAGDFAAVVTPYTTNGKMVIATITDQREAYVDIVFKQLNDSGNWVSPPSQGFAFILIDQVA